MGLMDFNPLVAQYDETRVVDADSLAGAIRWLVQEFPPAEFPCVLEPGIGTGRIAIPLAQQRYAVHGVDLSERMLAALADRLGKLKTPLPVTCQIADVESLPFPCGSYDMVVAVHLFYFIRGWKRAVAELLRVLRPDGPMVLMHTGMGMEIPFLNERYKELCAEEGFRIAPVGVGSTREVTDYLAELGCTLESLRDRWQWTSHVPLDKAISYVRSRAYSFTADVPDAVHHRAIRGVESAAKDRWGTLSADVPVENQVYLVVARKPPAGCGPKHVAQRGQT